MLDDDDDELVFFSDTFHLLMASVLGFSSGCMMTGGTLGGAVMNTSASASCASAVTGEDVLASLLRSMSN